MSLRQGAKLANSKVALLMAGSTLLALLCLTPVRNALILLDDFNYTFWAGSSTPVGVIFSCFSTVFLFMVVIFAFFRYINKTLRTEALIMLVAHIFILLLGFLLILGALPLVMQAEDAYTNMVKQEQCEHSEQTHRLFEHSQTLHAIRQQPGCIHRPSVEDCEGFVVSQPYTGFLKALENGFHCSGFCYKALPVVVQLDNQSLALDKGEQEAAPNQTMPRHIEAAPNQTLLHHIDHITKHPEVYSVPLMQLAADRHRLAQESFDPEQNISANTTAASRVKNMVAPNYDRDSEVKQSYPPTLFSRANYETSCESQSARNMRNVAGDIGTYMFFQGLCLVAIVVVTFFLKLIGLCTRKGDGHAPGLTHFFSKSSHGGVDL